MTPTQIARQIDIAALHAFYHPKKERKIRNAAIFAAITWGIVAACFLMLA